MVDFLRSPPTALTAVARRKELPACGDGQNAELFAKAELLDLILTATNDGIVDVNLRSGEARYSPRWKYLLGFDNEDIPDGAERPELWRELIHPDDAERVARLLQEHVAQGWPFSATLRMRHRHGGYRHILCRGATHRDAADRAQRLVLIFADIDAQLRSEEQQRALALALPDTMFRVRRDGVILGLKLGKEPSGSPFLQLAQGRRLRECLGSALGERVESALFGDEGNSVNSLELNSGGTQGEPIHHELRVVRSGEDEAVCIVRDVTERYALEQRLIRSQKLEAVGHLAAGVAHEINTPMQYIGDNLAFSREALDDLLPLIGWLVETVEQGTRERLAAEVAAEVADHLGDADFDYVRNALPQAIARSLDGVSRVTAIVRAMKAFAHPGSGQLEPADLGKIVENTVVLATNEWKYVADVETEYDPDLPPVPCVSGEISQVVLNLVVNACHAIGDVVGSSGQKGRIVITTGRHEESAEIRISDTGGGIPEHVRAKVFDPFFTTKEVGKGTGQGLALAHACVVKRHKGSIHFETEVGRGTTFFIRLPFEPSSNGR